MINNSKILPRTGSLYTVKDKSGNVLLKAVQCSKINDGVAYFAHGGEYKIDDHEFVLVKGW